MRFMIIVKATAESEAGVMPEEALMDRMGQYHEELARAGMLLDASGLQASSKGWRITYSGDRTSFVDGPFAEAKELIAGYTLIKANSRQEAIEWTKRFPNPAVNGKAGEIEVRQLFELDDFAPSAAVDRFRELDARLASATAATDKVQPIPEGMRSVTPHLVCDGAAAAIDFYKAAFGATEVARLPGPDGRLMHGLITIGDSAVMLVDESPQFGMLGPKTLRGTPVTIHLYVPDADAFVEQAVAAGAKVVMPLANMFWGDRYGVLEDPCGHHWSVATHIRDVQPQEMAQAMKTACSPEAMP